MKPLLKNIGRGLLLWLWLIPGVLLANPSPKQTLLEEARQNLSLLQSNPTEAYRISKKIESRAHRQRAEEAEMWALITQCQYHEMQNNFDALQNAAQKLDKRALTYDLPVFQAISKSFLYNVYYDNEMYERALGELNQGLTLLEKADSDSETALKIKRNLLIAYSNYYMVKKDYNRQISYIRLVLNEVKKLQDPDTQNQLFYLHYANLGAAHYNIGDLHKAEFYSKRSTAHRPEQKNDNIEFLILSTLGKVKYQQKEFSSAVDYFETALNQNQGYINHNNKIHLLGKIIASCDSLNHHQKRKEYVFVRDSIQLEVLKEKNTFLKTLVSEDETDSNSGSLQSLSLIISMVVLMLLLIGSKYFLHKPIIVPQLVENFHPLTAPPKINRHKKHKDLIELLKKNDPAFLTLFNQLYPQFTDKLYALHPTMVLSEIEFCALLKLKLSSKEIAQYKFITHKTVQNKKYLIRKKLNIPSKIDIYRWFDEI